jgi:hypothetical protein
MLAKPAGERRRLNKLWALILRVLWEYLVSSDNGSLFPLQSFQILKMTKRRIISTEANFWYRTGCVMLLSVGLQCSELTEDL